MVPNVAAVLSCGYKVLGARSGSSFIVWIYGSWCHNDVAAVISCGCSSWCQE